MTGVICGGTAAYFRRVYECPTEHKRRRILGRFTSVWYDIDWTCLGCGDSWSGGEYRPRPFYRYWRRDAIRRAKDAWKRSFSLPDGRTVMRAELAAIRPDSQPETP